MKRKIAAILAADVAGYSKLVAADEERTIRRLEASRQVFDDLVKRYGGRIFNTAGDAVLAEFASAVEAVRCALEIQESLRTKNLGVPEADQMHFRLGINLGDVIEKDGDLLGDGVNIAARLEGIAEPGGICVSRAVYEQVQNKLAVDFANIGPQSVKNIPTPIHAYRVSPENPLADQVKAQGSGFQRWLVPGAVAAIVAVAAAATSLLIAIKRPALQPPDQESTAPSKGAATTPVEAKASPPPPAVVAIDTTAVAAQNEIAAATSAPRTDDPLARPTDPPPAPRPAPTLTAATFDVALWCEKLAWTPAALNQTGITLTLKAGKVDYTRPIHWPTLTSPIIGYETGSGTLDATGNVQVRTRWESDRRRFTAYYEGAIGAGGGTLKGTQNWVSDGKAYKRPCVLRLSPRG